MSPVAKPLENHSVGNGNRQELGGVTSIDRPSHLVIEREDCTFSGFALWFYDNFEVISGYSHLIECHVVELLVEITVHRERACGAYREYRGYLIVGRGIRAGFL